jgi:hypothetical protein
MKKITKYKLQMKMNHPPNTPNHSPNSFLFPIFLSSQLPSFPPYPLAASDLTVDKKGNRVYIIHVKQ